MVLTLAEHKFDLTQVHLSRLPGSLVEVVDSETDVEFLDDLKGGIIFGSHLATSHALVVVHAYIGKD